MAMPETLETSSFCPFVTVIDHYCPGTKEPPQQRHSPLINNAADIAVGHTEMAISHSATTGAPQYRRIPPRAITSLPTR